MNHFTKARVGIPLAAALLGAPLAAQAPSTDFPFYGAYLESGLPTNLAVPNIYACDVGSTDQNNPVTISVDHQQLGLPISTPTNEKVQITGMTSADDDFPLLMTDWLAGASSETRHLHVQYSWATDPSALSTADVVMDNYGGITVLPSILTVADPQGSVATTAWGSIRFPVFFTLNEAAAQTLVPGTPFTGATIFAKLDANSPLVAISELATAFGPGNQVDALAMRADGILMCSVAAGSAILVGPYSPGDPLENVTEDSWIVFVHPALASIIPSTSGVTAGVPEVWGDLSLPKPPNALDLSSLRIYDPLADNGAEGSYDPVGGPGGSAADQAHIRINGSVGSGDRRVAANSGDQLDFQVKLPPLAAGMSRAWVLYAKFGVIDPVLRHATTDAGVYEFDPGVYGAFRPWTDTYQLETNVIPITGNIDPLPSTFSTGYAVGYTPSVIGATFSTTAPSLPAFLGIDVVYQVFAFDFDAGGVYRQTSSAIELNIADRVAAAEYLLP